MGIINRIRQARWRHQAETGQELSLEKAAEAIGVTPANLSKLETGKQWPSRSTLEKLCKFYRVKPGDLIDYAESGDELGT